MILSYKYYTRSDQIISYPRFVLSSFSSSLSQVLKFISSFSPGFSSFFNMPLKFLSSPSPKSLRAS